MINRDWGKPEPEGFATQNDPARETPRPQDPTGSGWGSGSEEFLELIIDTLEKLDEAAQGAFLQKFLKTLVNMDVTEKESIMHWQNILRQRSELADRLNRRVSLRTAAVDYFGESLRLRNHVLLEYEELKRLRHSAATDPLTGLYNRRFFQEHLERELNRADRYSSPFALLLIDLRSFKRANDTYGHAVGDEILRSVGRACVEVLRGSDIPCRIGGDEFAILFPETEPASAEGLARRIARKLEDSAKTLAPEAGLGLDYGVASFPADAKDGAQLFDAADRALYANKQSAYQRGERRGVEPAVSTTEVKAPENIPLATSSPQPPEPAEPAQAASPSGAEPEPTPLELPISSASARDFRRYERMPLAEAQGLGVMTMGSTSKMVRVLDMSFGGVGLLVDKETELSETFRARLHVPLLPRAEYTLHRIYSHPAPGSKQRVGCSFAPLLKSPPNAQAAARN